MQQVTQQVALMLHTKQVNQTCNSVNAAVML